MGIFKNNRSISLYFDRLKLYGFYGASVLAIILVIAGSFVAEQIFETRLRAEKGDALTAILEQSEDALLDWHSKEKKAVLSWAQTYMVREVATGLLAHPADAKTLEKTLEQEVLREMLTPLINTGDYQGFFIISTEKINLASYFGIHLGEISDIPDHILEHAIAGQAAIAPIQKANVPLPDMKGGQVLDQPTMFSVAPINNQSGEVIALLALRIDPVKNFTTMLQRGRLAETGETYAFNRAGLMISDSRFDRQLRDLGILGTNQRSVLNLSLRNPGVNLMAGVRPEKPLLLQPLTLMAKSAVQGRNGQNLEGYNDYRGVPVIGAWRWNESLDLGLATEIDVEEAYATLRLSRYLVIFGTSLGVLIIIMLNVVFMIARRRVAKSEASLVNAQRISHLGSWEWDIVRNRLEWSDETYRIFRQNPEQFKVSYEAFINTVHPDDRETVIQEVERALKNNKHYEVEHRIECPDGTERIVLEKAELELNILGKPAYMHGSVLDITERKKAEQELTLFKTTSDMIEDCLFMFNPRTLKFFYVNQAAIQQLGYTEEELLDMTPLDIKPKFDEESFRALINPLIKGSDKTLLFQTVHMSKNGSLIPVDIALQYLAPQDENARFVAIVRDFSERQRIERQLKTEKEKAEQATKYKSEFLANMSHEIRTPMNGVLGMLELLEITKLNEKQKSYLQIAESSAKSLLTIINDILDFSKIEAGRMQLESTVFNLHKIVEDSVISLSKQAEARQLDLNCYISADVPTFVIGDPVRLRQVITNLINNAIKFTVTGEVNFRLRNVSDNDKQVCLCFEVQDTGVGIEEKKYESLFDAFAQADGSTTRKYGGTGLGLTICKQLVTMMGGNISVSSQPGSGSTFSFIATFPKVAHRVGQSRQQLPEDLRVLVVDDNETNQTILSSYLSNWKVENDGVGDVSDVLSTLRDASVNGKPYHVILLDFHLPKIDGLKLAQMIKADKELQSSHLIMLSSSGMPIHDAVEGRSTIERYLTKPVRQSDLYDALLQVTGQIKTQPTEQRVYKEKNVLFRDARVLLVDDVTTNQAVGREMLNLLGIEPLLASDGNAALRELTKSDFDLVLMDCQMPVMDGYAATEIIRAKEQAEGSKHLPIIALTANAMKGDKEACISAGMDDYLAKPITLDNLRRILSHWLPDDLQQPDLQQQAMRDYPVEEKASDSTIGTVSPVDVSDSVLDSRTLDDLRKLAGDRFSLLINSFEQDINKSLSTLRDAIKQNSAEAVVLAAHAIKGAGMSMSAIRFSECCKTLEMQARKGDVADAQSQLKNIEDEYQRVIKELRALS